jgi:hypothetical protein
MSPYNYCANNPVILVDPDGRVIILTGPDSGESASQLDAQTSFAFGVKLGADGKTLTCSGIALTKKDRALRRMIRDENVTVEMICRNDNNFNTKDGMKHTKYGGGFGGGFYDDENGAQATQLICPTKLANFDAQFNDNSYGETMLHEAAEAYAIGYLALETFGSFEGWGDANPKFNYAHNEANKIALGNVSDVERTDTYIGYVISIPTPTPKNHFNTTPSVNIGTRKVQVPSGKTRCK